MKAPGSGTRSRKTDAERTIDVDPRVYGLTAVKAAAYRFADRCFVSIDLTNEGSIQVSFSAKTRGLDLDTIEKQLMNEILDQDLRERIGRETEALRNLIIAHAFSQTSLIDAEFETSPYESDPMGVLNPEKPPRSPQHQ